MQWMLPHNGIRWSVFINYEVAFKFWWQQLNISWREWINWVIMRNMKSYHFTISVSNSSSNGNNAYCWSFCCSRHIINSREQPTKRIFAFHRQNVSVASSSLLCGMKRLMASQAEHKLKCAVFVDGSELFQFQKISELQMERMRNTERERKSLNYRSATKNQHCNTW